MIDEEDDEGFGEEWVEEMMMHSKKDLITIFLKPNLILKRELTEKLINQEVTERIFHEQR